jgi:cytochrome P450
VVNRTAVDPATHDPAFDLLDPAWTSDPYPHYAELRERAPVHRHPEGFWALSRHADCLALLRDRRASSDSVHVPERLRRPGSEDKPMAAARLEMRPFLFRDPPDHTRLRGLVAKTFTPKMVERMRQRTHLMVDELLNAALEADDVDLLEEFASPLPVRVICDLLGVPIEDRDRFRVWSRTMARGLDPDFLLTEETMDARDEAVVQFAAYFFELLADRRRHLGEDLLSHLAEVEDGGATLSEVEIFSTCILLLVAGHETTVNLLSGGVLALLRHPDQLERFCTDPDVRRGAVEEMLRYVSPVQMTARTITEDCEFDDHRFAAGDFILLLLASGNRDPAQFDEPERFDITRTPNNHLGLGFGIHHCLGATLARMETQVALERLFERAPRLALATDVVTYSSNVVLRGMESLPVVMHG